MWVFLEVASSSSIFRCSSKTFPPCLLFPTLFTFSLFTLVTLLPHHKKAVSLFSANDSLLQLDYLNINGSLFHQQSAFFVEFYSSWCGHCIHFAPIWKKLAAETYQWTNVIRVAAINCASEENFPVCTAFEIRGFPTIKSFPANAVDSQKGLEVVHQSVGVETLKRKMVDFLGMHVGPQRPAAWPSFDPLKKDAAFDALSRLKDGDDAAIVLVFDRAQSYLSKFITLDLSSDSSLKVLGVDLDVFEKENKRFLSHFDLNKVPSAYVILTNMQTKVNQVFNLNVNLSDAIALQTEVKRLIPSSVVGITFKPQPPPFHLSTAHRPKPPVGVFVADLQKMIRYALLQEIGMRKSLNGDALQAATSFVHLLAKYLPLKVNVNAFIQNLDAWLQGRGNASLSGQEWLKKLQEGSAEVGGKLPVVGEWVGCKGSQETLRGYPCSVWTLFHVLTVAAADANRHVPEAGMQAQEGREVLDIMASYVHHFFGCRRCADHFDDMIKEDLDDSVQTYNDAILWLWKAHNKVNVRLKGEKSEDPVLPKVEFPIISTCLSCRIEGNQHAWHYMNVLKFLKNFYRNITFEVKLEKTKNVIDVNVKNNNNNIKNSNDNNKKEIDNDVKKTTKYRGINSIDIGIEKPRFRLGTVWELKNKKQEERRKKLLSGPHSDHVDVQKLREKERETRNSHLLKKRKHAALVGPGVRGVLGFTDWDISICFGAYGICAILLVILYLAYIDRRCRRWTKKYRQKKVYSLLDDKCGP